MSQRLTSLTVSGFRALDSLHIPALADINLIVGKNSTGKSTVLEALQLVLSRDVRSRLYNMLADREEWAIRRWQAASRLNDPDKLEMSFEALFSGRPDLSSKPSFRICGSTDQASIQVDFEWLRPDRRDDATVRYLPSEGPDYDMEVVPGFHVERSESSLVIPLDRINRMITRRMSMREPPERNVIFLGSSGMTMDEIGQMWDSVALTDDEDDVVQSLRIITPDLEKLVMVQSPEARTERMLMAKVAGFSSPIPFKSLGEGAIQLLSVALGIIQARGATLLIDEISSGIHYSVQDKVWELIFRQAARFDIQVFATTHSLDCVRALHRADCKAQTGPSAALHRIEKVAGQLRAVTFSSAELEIAAEEEIEVR